VQAPAPPLNPEGNFSIYFERLDKLLIDAIKPLCFMCGNYLQVSDEKCVVFRSKSFPIRMHVTQNQSDPESLPCYDNFVVGLALFNGHQDQMRTFDSGIQ